MYIVVSEVRQRPPSHLAMTPFAPSFPEQARVVYRPHRSWNTAAAAQRTRTAALAPDSAPIDLRTVEKSCPSRFRKPLSPPLHYCFRLRCPVGHLRVLARMRWLNLDTLCLHPDGITGMVLGQWAIVLVAL